MSGFALHLAFLLADTYCGMNRGINAVASGMIASQRWMDVVANNLANSSTTGFKADGLSFNDTMVRTLFANSGSGPLLGSLGSGGVERGQTIDFSQGELKPTGNMLDLALQGDGMFAVQTPNGIRYTRSGNFRIDDNLLVNSEGFPVLDERGREIVMDPNFEYSIDDEGAVGFDGRPAGRIGVFQGVFARDGEGYFTAENAVSADMNSEGHPRVVQGSLEGSNVSTIQAMIDMIRLGRTFELAQKSVQSQDELTQRLIESLQNR